jgi:hypothetical protein
MNVQQLWLWAQHPKTGKEVGSGLEVGCGIFKLAVIIYSAFGKYLRKNGNTMKQCISSL